MKICLKCNRGLFDNDIKCDKCGCADIMDKYEYKELYERFKNASFKEQERLRQSEEYKTICKYKFIIDTKNTPEMRKAQSTRDKQIAKQREKEYRESLQNRFQHKQVEEKCLQEQPNTPKCPICQSTDLAKISTAKKAGKIILFGIFGAGDVGKTWKCNNCGSKF